MTNPSLRLMSVHAHPDDESSKGAATLARYTAEGVDALVVTCTGGERGDVLNPALDRAEVWQRLPELRREEMAEAARILGVRQRFLGFIDSGLPVDGAPLPNDCFARAPLDVAARRLTEVMREFRPHVVITYDESGGYPHPDHIRTHEVAVAAFDAAADPRRYPDAGAPWQPLKLYYQGALSHRWFQTLHDAITARGLESPMREVLDEWPDAPTQPVTTRVECADYFPVRDRAALAHATQIAPDGPFFATPRDIERQVWPVEEYQRVRCLVDSPLPEDDLFAGIRQAQRRCTPRPAAADTPLWTNRR
jgi:mycothiol S-conjugate amidase